jgi:membrane-associated phospholipid phosphatase
MNDANIYLAESLGSVSNSFLLGMYEWGINVIKVIQRIENPALTVLIKIITALGTDMFYMPIVLLVIWWINEKKGFRLGLLVLISAWVNTFFKDLLKQPRPFNFEPALGLAHESSYGAPSGHAQTSMCFWIFIAVWLTAVVREKAAAGGTKEKEKTDSRIILIWALSVFIILLIGYTRLYLGVHFPTDLFLGWTVSGIILLVWFIPGSTLEKRLTGAGVRVQNICAVAVTLIMNALVIRDRSISAMFLGLCLGYILMMDKFPFSAKDKINGKKPGIPVLLLRALIGFLGFAVIYLGLKFILPGDGGLFGGVRFWSSASPFYEIGRFLRYGLLGMWASLGSPYVFERMGLAPNNIKAPSGVKSGRGKGA